MANAPSMVRKRLDDCDFEMAKALIIEKLGGGVLPNDLVRLLDELGANPCVDTALKLLEFDGNLIAFFELCRPGSIYHLNHSTSPR